MVAINGIYFQHEGNIMSAVKDNNFITIQGWMRNQLNLKGNELLIYALIYGFSQDGESRFKGSRKYIADWCGCSLNTVDRSLGSLVDKGYLAKYPYTDACGNRLVDYVAIQPPTAEPEPKTQPKKTRKTNSFDAIIDAYTDDPTTKDLLGAWLQNRKAKRAAMTDRAIQGNINKLDRRAQESHMSVNDYLDEIVCRGWTSFFPIDSYQRTGYQKPQRQSQQPSWTPTEEERRQQEEADNDFLNNCVF